MSARPIASRQFRSNLYTLLGSRLFTAPYWLRKTLPVSSVEEVRASQLVDDRPLDLRQMELHAACCRRWLIASRLSSALVSMSLTAEHISTTCRSSGARRRGRRCGLRDSGHWRNTGSRRPGSSALSGRSRPCGAATLRKCSVPGTWPTSAICGREVRQRKSRIDRATPADDAGLDADAERDEDRRGDRRGSRAWL